MSHILKEHLTVHVMPSHAVKNRYIANVRIELEMLAAEVCVRYKIVEFVFLDIK